MSFILGFIIGGWTAVLVICALSVSNKHDNGWDSFHEDIWSSSKDDSKDKKE